MTTFTPTSISPAYTPSLGTQPEAISYWSTALPLLDLVKAGGGWTKSGLYNAPWVSTGELDLDDKGWVRSLPPGTDDASLMVLFNNSAAPKGARYVVLYEGQGTLIGNIGTKVVESSPGRLVITSDPEKGLINLKLTDTDPSKTGDYLRNIQVVREDLLPLHEAGLSFNPAFLDKVEDFHTLRFMDWSRTNSIFDKSGAGISWQDALAKNVMLDWADRPLVDDRSWSRMPVEALVELANRTGTDPWFNMPVNASDDYVRGFAAYVRDHLRPDLKIHVEYSNEVWNWAFPQSHYAKAQAEKMFGTGANWMEWYGVRTAQVGQIWNEVFGEPIKGAGDPGRVSVVYNTQFGWRGLEDYGLDTIHWKDANGNHIKASDYIDEYAVTGYYYLNDTPETVMSWWSEPDGGYAKALASIQASAAKLAPGYQYHAAEAQGRGLDLVVYEAGTHIITPPSQHSNQAYVDFIINLNRRPELYQIDMDNFAAFKAAGGDLFMSYNTVGAPSKWGSWGALESVNQTTSPRYQAQTDWNAANEPWYETGRSDVTFQNARYYVAGDAGETIVGTAHGYDVLVGGAGADTFVSFGPGSSLDGREGNDTVRLAAENIYSFTSGNDGSVLVTTQSGTITLRNIEMISFGGAAVIPITDIIQTEGLPPPPPSEGEPAVDPPPSGRSLGRYYLIDADTHAKIIEVKNGDTISSSLIGDRNVTLVAETDNGSVQSVKMAFDGAPTRIENIEPYALFGDTDGDLQGGFKLGHQNNGTFEFYSADGAMGTLLGTESLFFVL